MGSYAGIRRLVQILCSAFFREIEVIGEDNVPRTRGVLFIAWHPNGMLDPMLLVATAPRQPRFGARHGIFRWPLLGSLLRKAGVVPVYRAMDLRGGHSAPDVKARNAASLTALAKVLASGGIAGLFFLRGLVTMRRTLKTFERALLEFTMKLGTFAQALSGRSLFPWVCIMTERHCFVPRHSWFIIRRWSCQSLWIEIPRLGKTMP